MSFSVDWSSWTVEIPGFSVRGRSRALGGNRWRFDCTRSRTCQCVLKLDDEGLMRWFLLVVLVTCAVPSCQIERYEG
jgi:hypothetical protein